MNGLPVTFDDLLQKLSSTASTVDQSQTWPTEQFQWLAETDVLRWVIPSEFGGRPLLDEEFNKGYERLAQACLTTCFALTQRNGACRRLVGSENESLKQELLPKLSEGEIFATVGISHLTTSRQHLSQPAVAAELVNNQWILNGTIPWVTGSSAADFIVTGGTCADRKQVLISLPTDLPGVSIHPKAELMALTASETSSVDLHDVRVPAHYLMAGPLENVMSKGKGGGAGSLTTSILALGLIKRSLALIKEEAEKRDELDHITNAFDLEANRLSELIYSVSTPEGKDNSPATIRHLSNSLALRITQAALAVTKGAGFSTGHPAELAVREAMFFLVWSCPQIVVNGVLSELSCLDGFTPAGIE